VQLVSPAPEKVPGRHIEHVWFRRAPSTVENVPEEQGVQVVVPVPEAKVPAGQFIQEDMPRPDEKVPLKQVVHICDTSPLVVFENVPVGHREQKVAAGRLRVKACS
jgi:hypothetical protein